MPLRSSTRHSGVRWHLVTLVLVQATVLGSSSVAGASSQPSCQRSAEAWLRRSPSVVRVPGGQIVAPNQIVRPRSSERTGAFEPVRIQTAGYLISARRTQNGDFSPLADLSGSRVRYPGLEKWVAKLPGTSAISVVPLGVLADGDVLLNVQRDGGFRAVLRASLDNLDEEPTSLLPVEERWTVRKVLTRDGSTTYVAFRFSDGANERTVLPTSLALIDGGTGLVSPVATPTASSGWAFQGTIAGDMVFSAHEFVAGIDRSAKLYRITAGGSVQAISEALRLSVVLGSLGFNTTAISFADRETVSPDGMWAFVLTNETYARLNFLPEKAPLHGSLINMKSGVPKQIVVPRSLLKPIERSSEVFPLYPSEFGSASFDLDVTWLCGSPLLRGNGRAAWYRSGVWRIF